MGVVVYKSTDVGAPTLQGIVGGAYAAGWADGSLLQVLRKVLVTGYGSGAQAAGAGWTQPFNGTSKGVFQQGAGCGFCLRVLDDGTATAGAREAAVRGFESMSDVDTGLGAFPTTVQQAAPGLFWRKSDTADTAQRWWMIIADASTFYMFVSQGNTSTVYLSGWGFGNFHSLRASDAYNCMIMGRATSAAVDVPANEATDIVNAGSSAGSTATGHFIARGYNQQGTSVQVGKTGCTFMVNTGATAMGGSTSTSLAFPNPSDALMYLSRVYVVDPSTVPNVSIRGYLRGFYGLQHDGVKVPLDYTIGGTGTLAGRTIRVLGMRTASSISGRFSVETSDTWDA